MLGVARAAAAFEGAGEPVPPERRWIAGATRVVGLDAVLEVRDHGPGVPAAQERSLFQRFATGTRSGTGLGLFIVRELARAHGGEARYENAHPGARFIVTLPAHATAAAEPEPEGGLATPR